MRRENKRICKHCKWLNSFIWKKKRIFKDVPFFRVKRTGKKEYEVTSYKDKIYLKTKISGSDPYLEIKESWVSSNNYQRREGYYYRFVMPSITYGIECDNRETQSKEFDFEFRYETHPKKKDHWPKYHLHVLNKVPPKYPTHKIIFRDFFEIIEREFCDNGIIEFKC